LRGLATVPLSLIFIAPLLASFALIFPALGDLQSFSELLMHPQFWGGLWLSLFTGIASTALALLAAIVITGASRDATRLSGLASWFLAVPHLAFAIGLAFLIAPSGWLTRVFAAVAGWAAPPQWVTAQDPYGISLILALALKETPFLIWALASLLNRDDLKLQFEGHAAVARSLGHRARSIWWRVVLPQLLPRIVWPLVAVLAFGMTVVDMAIVIGPTQPPTLASVVWTDINDGELAQNRRGAAGVVVMAAAVAAVLCACWVIFKWLRPVLVQRMVRGPDGHTGAQMIGPALLFFISAIYLFVTAMLLVMSVAGHWPFPELWPKGLQAQAWQRLVADGAPVLNSFVLGLATSAAAVIASIAWMEAQPAARDTFVLALCGVALCVPGLVIALGQYRMFLLLGITGTWPAMLLAHVLPVAAYVFVMLHGPYRSYDDKWKSVSAGLLTTPWRFLWRIKWPMLKAPILAAAAVGFAVSVAQFVPAQLAASGRHVTLPMEAVTLSSGGNRPLLAAYALCLMLLPLLAFLVASWLGRPRWGRA
jgi:putative thiamine transport system permease protein